MKDKNPVSEADEQVAREFLASIKKAQDPDKKLLKDNTFIYFCLWSGFNRANAPNQGPQRVKAFPTPASDEQP